MKDRYESRLKEKKKFSERKIGEEEKEKDIFPWISFWNHRFVARSKLKYALRKYFDYETRGEFHRLRRTGYSEGALDALDLIR